MWVSCDLANNNKCQSRSSFCGSKRAKYSCAKAKKEAKKATAQSEDSYLKSMQKPKPMPNLMHRRLSQIIPIHTMRYLRHGSRKDITPISSIIRSRILNRRSPVRDGGREGAITEESLGARGAGIGREIGLEVEVQRRVGAAAERLFHFCAIGVRGPVVADYVGCAFYVEGYVCGAVGLVEDGGLVEVEMGILAGATFLLGISALVCEYRKQFTWFAATVALVFEGKNGAWSTVVTKCIYVSTTSGPEFPRACRACIRAAV